MTDEAYRGTSEPPVEELLADPILHLVLRRDGLSTDDVRRAIAVARRPRIDRRMAARTVTPAAAGTG